MSDPEIKTFKGIRYVDYNDDNNLPQWLKDVMSSRKFQEYKNAYLEDHTTPIPDWLSLIFAGQLYLPILMNKTPPMIHYPDLLTYVENAIAMSGIETVVSVGCGTGNVEACMREHFGEQIDIICVDPNPGSYPTSMYIDIPDCGTCVPDFKLVEDLVEKRPELRMNCIMVLNWPEPGRDITWDFDAICSLRPSVIVCRYESVGGAGGDVLHEFFDLVGAPKQRILGVIPTLDDVTWAKIHDLANEYETVDSLCIPDSLPELVLFHNTQDALVILKRR
jgi:hypothetical protein